MIPRRALLRAVLSVAIAFMPVRGLAHSQLVRSDPARRATVARPPARVQLWFSERLEPVYAEASVWNDAGTQVDARDARVDPADPSVLTVSTPNLGPGRYTVRFRVVSVDGHVVESSFTFTVSGAPR